MGFRHPAGDMLADRQTRTHTYSSQYFDAAPEGEVKMNLITVKWALRTVDAHNTAQNRLHNCPSYLPYNCHCSDDVFEGRGNYVTHSHVNKLVLRKE